MKKSSLTYCKNKKRGLVKTVQTINSQRLNVPDHSNARFGHKCNPSMQGGSQKLQFPTIPTPALGINGLKHHDFGSITQPIPDSNARFGHKWIETICLITK